MTGLVTADATLMVFVLSSACAMETKTSLSSIWESNIPTPLKPAASHSCTKAVTSGTGLQGGTLRSILMAMISPSLGC